MNYILIHWKFGRESMQKVVDNMEEDCQVVAKKDNGTWWLYESGSWVQIKDALKRLTAGKVINWGNHIINSDSFAEVNQSTAVALASNKARSRRVLRDAGVKVPKTVFPGESIKVKYPLIGRPSHHFGGKQFHIINNSKEGHALRAKYDIVDWYFSEVFSKTHEFRVHVAHGKVLVMHEKPLVDGELRANHTINQEDWHALKWSEMPRGVALEAIKAVRVLGLDYGAVDVMYNASNDTCAVCEVNTSPSIVADYTNGKYAAYFDWLIRHNYPEHLPIGADGKFVFYNQLLES